MSDLRTLHRTLADGAVVSTPPFGDVVANARTIRGRQIKSWAVAIGVIAVLAGVRLAPPIDMAVDQRPAGPSTTTTVVDSATSGQEAGPGDSPAATPDPAPSNDVKGPPATASPFACRAGANGGATGPGVTPTAIRLLVDAHLDGPKKALAEDATYAMKVVFDEVNEAGGICGRAVKPTVVNDLFRHRVEPDDYLAIVPAPLGSGFEARLADGSFDRWKILAVGADGADRAHFASPWSRPVGPPIQSFTRIVVDEAYRAGSRTFALVHDATTFPGVLAAFEDYVDRLPGAVAKATVALDPNDPSYANQANRFNETCGGGKCDSVVLALLPDTAKKWLQAGGAMGKVRTGIFPALSEGFGGDCARLLGPSCGDLLVWTGFTPPLPDFRGDPDVDRYAAHFSDYNPWTTGAYVTARAIVAALRLAGPDLDRERFRQALDAMTYRSGLVSQLDWSPENRVGNAAARAVRADTTQSTFQVWRDAKTGWVRDPMLGYFPG